MCEHVCKFDKSGGIKCRCMMLKKLIDNVCKLFYFSFCQLNRKAT